MRFELLPLLEAIASACAQAARSSHRCATSSRSASSRARNEETLDLVQRYFDLVLVHGDPAFARLEDTFPLASRDPRQGRLYRPRRRSSACAIVRALRRPDFRRRRRCRARSGPRGGRRGSHGARRPALVPDRRPQPAGQRLRGCRRGGASPALAVPVPRGFRRPACRRELSVSQAGYNTVCDICAPGAARCWCHSPPAARPSRPRAPSGWNGWGSPASSPEEALNLRRSHAAVEKALAGPKPPGNTLDLDGAKGSARRAAAAAGNRPGRARQSLSSRCLSVTPTDQHEARIFLMRQFAGKAQIREPASASNSASEATQLMCVGSAK